MAYKLIVHCLFVMAVPLACRGVNSGSASPDIHQKKPGDRGFSAVSRKAAAHHLKALQHGNPSMNQEHSTEAERPSNQEAEEKVYTIDYQGATTHPTPAPKHPTP